MVDIENTKQTIRYVENKTQGESYGRYYLQGYTKKT